MPKKPTKRRDSKKRSVSSSARKKLTRRAKANRAKASGPNRRGYVRSIGVTNPLYQMPCYFLTKGPGVGADAYSVAQNDDAKQFSTPALPHERHVALFTSRHLAEEFCNREKDPFEVREITSVEDLRRSLVTLLDSFTWVVIHPSLDEERIRSRSQSITSQSATNWSAAAG